MQLVADVPAGMLVGVFAACRPCFDVLAEVVGERELVQRAADDRLRLVLLGDDHAVQAVLPGGDPAVAADEVDVVRALHQQLGHDRVVVVLARRGSRCTAWSRCGRPG